MADHTIRKLRLGVALASATCVAASAYGLMHGTPDLSDVARALVLLMLAAGLTYVREKARPLGTSWRTFAAEQEQARSRP